MSNFDTSEVRLLTLNCWGLKCISKKREERIDAICAKLSAASSLYDIVALQEVWVEEDYEKLKASTQDYLQFAKRWYSGILTGPGLVVFSRWAIESSWIFRFPINGRPSAFWRGDWYVGKSAGSCVIQHPSGRRIEIINAHLHAPYAPSGDANYACHRASQAWDLSGIVHRACLSGNTVFLTGDLNYRPESVGMKLLELRAQLSDAWATSHDDPQHKDNLTRETSSDKNDKNDSKAANKRLIASLTPEEQITLAGVTCDSQLNTWRENYELDRAKRLDYIFYDQRTVSVLHSKVVFTEVIPGTGSMSDHFGVTATFALHSEFALAAGPSHKLKNASVPALQSSKLRQVTEELLGIIADYKPVVERQAGWRLLHFGLSNVVLIGLMVAVWWGAARNRAYVGFIFVAVSIIIAITGYVDGLIGLLFGRNEKRAMKEFESQVELAQKQFI